jgi:hypothetical protein
MSPSFPAPDTPVVSGPVGGGGGVYLDRYFVAFRLNPAILFN